MKSIKWCQVMTVGKARELNQKAVAICRHDGKGRIMRRVGTGAASPIRHPCSVSSQGPALLREGDFA